MKILSRLFGFKTVAATMFITASTSFVYGLYVANEHYDNERLKQAREYLGLRDIAHDDNVKNVQQLERNKAKIRELKQKTKGLANEIKDYRRCDLTYDAERMYNFATAGTSNTTPAPGQESETIARITQGQQIEHARLNGLDYQSLLNEYYSLKRHYKANCLQIKTN